MNHKIEWDGNSCYDYKACHQIVLRRQHHNRITMATNCALKSVWEFDRFDKIMWWMGALACKAINRLTMTWVVNKTSTNKWVGINQLQALNAFWCSKLIISWIVDCCRYVKYDCWLISVHWFPIFWVCWSTSHVEQKTATELASTAQPPWRGYVKYSMERQMSAQHCIFSEHENSYATDHDRKIDSLSSNSTHARSDPAMTGGKVQTINRLSTQFMSCNDHFYAETNWRSELNNFTFIKYFWWLVSTGGGGALRWHTNYGDEHLLNNFHHQLEIFKLFVNNYFNTTQFANEKYEDRLNSTQLLHSIVLLRIVSTFFLYDCGFHWIFIEHEYQH